MVGFLCLAGGLLSGEKFRTKNKARRAKPASGMAGAYLFICLFVYLDLYLNA